MHWRHRAWFNAFGNHNGLVRRQAGRLVVKDAGAAPALWQVRARQGQEREQTCPRTQRLVITQSPRPAQNQLCHSLSIEAWRFCSFQHLEKHKISSWSMTIVCLAENVIVNESDLGHKDNGWGYYWLEKLDNFIQQCTVAKLAQTEPNVALFAHRIGTKWPKKRHKKLRIIQASLCHTTWPKTMLSHPVSLKRCQLKMWTPRSPKTSKAKQILGRLLKHEAYNETPMTPLSPLALCLTLSDPRHQAGATHQPCGGGLGAFVCHCLHYNPHRPSYISSKERPSLALNGTDSIYIDDTSRISCSVKTDLKSECRALKTNLGGAGSFKILRVTHLSLPGGRWEVGIHLKLGTNTNEIPKTQQSRRVIRNWDLTHFDSLFGRQSGRDWNQCFLIWKSNHHHHYQ